MSAPFATGLEGEGSVFHARRFEPLGQPRPAPALLWYGDTQPEPPPYLIDGVLPQKQIAVVAGQSMAGKTFVGVDLAKSVMTGAAFIGREVKRTGAVLWLAAEGRDEVAVRLKAALVHHFGEREPDKVPFAMQAFEVPVLTAADALPQLMALVDASKAGLAERFPGVDLVMIVVDTLNSAAGFDDENSSSETQKVMNLLRRLSDASGALVVIVDHYGKVVETGIRGSSAKIGAADAVLAVLADKNAEGEISNRRLAVVKLRSAPTGQIVPFKLKPVPVDAWGNTHCGIEWTVASDNARPSEAKTGKAAWTGNAKVLRSAVERATIDDGAIIRPFGMEGPEVKAVEHERLRAEFYSVYPAENQVAKNKAFNRLRTDALAKSLIASREIAGVDWIWLVSGDPKP